MTADDRLIFLVFSAQQKLRMYLNDALMTAGVPVTVTQAGILFLLKQKDGRTMTGLADRLEKAGFVKRVASPGDRRASHIHITPQGIGEVEGAKKVIRRINEEIKTGYPGDDIEAFKRVLNGFFDKFSRSGSAKSHALSPASPAFVTEDEARGPAKAKDD